MTTKLLLEHLPLEPYRSRYTECLKDWEHTAFSQSFHVNSILPETEVRQIATGEVLDAVGRPVWAMRQMLKLMEKAPEIGRVYFSDFFHPGLSALPYSRATFAAYAFCWAQTFDIHDFTRMHLRWMRPWEHFAYEVFNKVFVATEMQVELIAAIAPGWEGRTHAVGLPFNSRAVHRLLPPQVYTRDYDVVWSSRFDREKVPGHFLDLVEAKPEWSFVICTGREELTGTDTEAVDRARRLQAAGKLQIFTALRRPEYYSVLARSKVQFNSALQDWVSYTLLEALTFGCYPVYPNYRAFPETFRDMRGNFLYRNKDEAIDLIDLALNGSYNKTEMETGRAATLRLHDEALLRIAEHMV